MVANAAVPKQAAKRIATNMFVAFTHGFSLVLVKKIYSTVRYRGSTTGYKATACISVRSF
jgi:hypothetical protein